MTVEVVEPPAVELPKRNKRKLVVLGGNGFVGSFVCKEALQMGLEVVSVNRWVPASLSPSLASGCTVAARAREPRITIRRGSGRGTGRAHRWWTATGSTR